MRPGTSQGTLKKVLVTLASGCTYCARFVPSTQLSLCSIPFLMSRTSPHVTQGDVQFRMKSVVSSFTYPCYSSFDPGC
eukprot:g34031.t1